MDWEADSKGFNWFHLSISLPILEAACRIGLGHQVKKKLTKELKWTAEYKLIIFLKIKLVKNSDD